MAAIGPFLKENGLTLGVLGVIVVAFLLLRSTATPVASTDAFLQQVATQDATIAYFFSNT
jgi:hypothetical protein